MSRCAKGPSPTRAPRTAGSHCPASRASSAVAVPTRARQAPRTITSSAAAKRRLASQSSWSSACRPSLPPIPMAASDMPRLGLAGLIVLLLTPTFAAAQSAGEVERCFQNPAGCPSSAPSPPPPAAAPPPRAAAPADYSTVLRSPDPERRKLQESLRTLDKYHGPIDGKLQSEASEKA